MSKVVDDRVVSMKFDNAQFERNVSTSMSTLDKLKQKLKFKGASQGLDDINKAAKNVNFNTLSASADAVAVRFSHMQMSIQHQLDRMVDSCFAAGKKMVSALTIDPVKTGFQEYETQMGAIQTILANTQKEGTNVEIVNRALDELNEYADKTIYNFTEMTRNIGTFTAAGVKLDESVQAIKGIANLAAVSGSTSQQASTAMYQLSQALAAGKVSLMDWNSVVNAGMGGQVFQDALLRTSDLLQTGGREAVKMYGSFRESLTKGEWLTKEVLTETLAQLSGAYSKADLIAQGFSESQANEITKLAETAISAATEVKTFTQLWDTLKESAQSGWSQTWRMIVGDFDQAKERMTGLSKAIGGFIEKMSDSRNNYLEGALTSSLDKITKKMNVLGIETDTFKNKIKALAKSHNVDLDAMIKETGSFEKALRKAFNDKKLDKSIVSEAIKELTGYMTDATKSTEKMAAEMEEYGKIADRVIIGEFGNGAERIQKLAEAGYDYAMVQNLVNEKLGDSTRHESELTKKYGESAKALSTLTKEQQKTADAMSRLSDEQLKEKGYTEEQIRALRFLSGEADKTGKSIDDLINSMGKKSGSELIWESISNVIDSISEKFKIIGEAWHNVFGDADSGALYNIIEYIHEFTESLTMSQDQANAFRTVMEGIFSGLSITGSLFTKSLTAGFKLLSAVLGLFGTDVIGLAEIIANYIIQLKEWLDEHTLIIGTFDKLAAVLVAVITGIHDCVKAFLKLTRVKEIIEAIGGIIVKVFGSITNSLEGVGIDGFVKKIEELFDSLQKAIEGLGESDLFNAGIDIILGLINGLSSGIGKAVGYITDLAVSIINTFASILGIHSPSTVFIEFGKNIVEGLVEGVVSMINGVINAIKFVGDTIKNGWDQIKWDKIQFPEGLKDALGNLKEFLINFEWDKLLAIIPIAGVMIMAKKFFDVAEVLADGIESINGVLKSIKSVFGGFADIEKAYAKNLNAKAFRNMAISIAILAAAVAVLAFIPIEKLAGAVVVVTILAGVLLALAFAMKNMEGAAVDIGKGGIKLNGLKSGLVAMGAALLLIAVVVKIMGSMDIAQAIQGFVGLGIMVGAIVAVFAAYGKLVKGGQAKNMDKAAKMIRKLATTLLIMALVCKLIGMLSVSDMVKGGIFMTAFGVFVSVMMNVTKGSSKNINKVGKMVRNIALAMALMVVVCKLVGLLNAEDMIKGGVFAAAFVIFVKNLVKATSVGKDSQLAKLGTLLLSMTVSMALMVGVCKLAGLLTIEDMVKGAAFVFAFGVMVKALVEVTKIGSDQQMAKVSGTILSFSIAVGLLAGVCILLGMLTVEQIAKGVTAITFLGLAMAAMVQSTKGAQNVKSSLVTLVVAVAMMGAVVAAISNIPADELKRSVASLTILMGTFALMIRSLKGIKKVPIGGILALTAVVAALATILHFLPAGGEVGKAIETAASIGLLLLAMAETMKILDGVGHISKSAMKTMGILTLVLAGVATILGVLTYFDVGSTIENAASLSLLMLALSESVKIMGDAGQVSKSAMKTMGVLTAVLAGVAIILGVVTALDVGPSLETAAALSTVLLAMSGAALILSMIGPVSDAGVIGAAKMLALVTVAGTILAALGGLIASSDKAKEFLEKGIPVLETIGKAIGSLFGGIIGGFLEGATSGLPAVGEDIATFMENISTVGEHASKIKEGSFDGVKDLIETMGEIALTTVGTTLSDALHIFEGGSMGAFENDAVALVKAMKAIAKECTGFSFNEDGFEIVMTIAKKLSKLQKSLGDNGGFFSMFTGKNISLETFAEDAEEFITAMKSVASNCTGFSFNEAGFETIIKVATALSELQKSFGDMGGLFSIFTGKNVTLESFSNDAAEFIGAMKSVANNCTGFSFDEAGFETIITIATRLSEFQKSIGTIGGIASIFTGENVTLDRFSDDAAEFIGAMKSVASNCGGFTFDAAGFENMMTVATRLSELQSSLEPMGGVISWFKGHTDLGTFGDNIGDFAAGMSNLQEKLGENGVSAETIGTVIDAAKKLAELSDVLPEDSWFDGKMDLSDFGGHLFNFGSAMSKFGNATDNLNPEQINVAIDAANKIKELINSLVGIDTSGLIVFTGIGMGGLGADGAVSDVAKAIADFCKKTDGIDPTKLDVATSAAIKLKDLISDLVGLDTSGIENFKIDSIGTSLSNYSVKVQNIDPGIVSSSVTSALRLKDLVIALVGVDTSGVLSFSNVLPGLGTSVGTYATNVLGMDVGSVAASTVSIRNLIDLIKDMVGIDTSGVSAFKAAIDELATVQIGSLVAAFEGASTQMVSSGVNLISSLVSGIESASGTLTSTMTTIIASLISTVTAEGPSFTTSGETLATNLSTGISNKSSDVSSAVTTVVTTAASGINAHYSTFQSSGIYLGQGLVIGIQSMEQAAYDAGYALGAKAAQGEKDGQDSNSPSKLTIQAGKWLGEGLIIGIDKMGNKVYKSGRNMGETATRSISSAINRVSDIINTDIDTNPTIRPVLDLDDIKSGAKSINSMLSNDVMFGATTNVNAVNAMMNRRIQNGATEDVVSAINRLRKDLGNISGNTTYNVNGVTYDDGSNVTEAVKALVRAAKVERRV